MTAEVREKRSVRAKDAFGGLFERVDALRPGQWPAFTEIEEQLPGFWTMVKDAECRADEAASKYIEGKGTWGTFTNSLNALGGAWQRIAKALG